MFGPTQRTQPRPTLPTMVAAPALASSAAVRCVALDGLNSMAWVAGPLRPARRRRSPPTTRRPLPARCGCEGSRYPHTLSPPPPARSIAGPPLPAGRPWSSARRGLRRAGGAPRGPHGQVGRPWGPAPPRSGRAPHTHAPHSAPHSQPHASLAVPRRAAAALLASAVLAAAPRPAAAFLGLGGASKDEVYAQETVRR